MLQPAHPSLIQLVFVGGNEPLFVLEAYLF